MHILLKFRPCISLARPQITAAPPRPLGGTTDWGWPRPSEEKSHWGSQSSEEGGQEKEEVHRTCSTGGSRRMARASALPQVKPQVRNLPSGPCPASSSKRNRPLGSGLPNSRCSRPCPGWVSAAWGTLPHREREDDFPKSKPTERRDGHRGVKNKNLVCNPDFPRPEF